MRVNEIKAKDNKKKKFVDLSIGQKKNTDFDVIFMIMYFDLNASYIFNERVINLAPCKANITEYI